MLFRLAEQVAVAVKFVVIYMGNLHLLASILGVAICMYIYIYARTYRYATTRKKMETVLFYYIRLLSSWGLLSTFPTDVGGHMILKKCIDK